MGKEYLANDVCRITGVERRTIQTWVDGGFISPSVEKADGAGTRNRWSEDDLVALKVFSHLLTKGFSREAAAKVVGQSQRLFDINSDGSVSEKLGDRGLSFFFSYDLDLPTYAACVTAGDKTTSFVVSTALPIMKSVALVLDYMKCEEPGSLIVERIDRQIEDVYQALK